MGPVTEKKTAARKLMNFCKNVKRIFRYLIGTINYGIFYSKTVIINVLVMTQIGQEVQKTESPLQDIVSQ